MIDAEQDIRSLEPDPALTGRTIAVGAVVTLFALMQLTAKVDWEKAFGGRAVRGTGTAAEVGSSP